MKNEHNSAIVLFETVRRFRRIRDQFRMRRLAQALGFPVLEFDEDLSMAKVEELVNRLADRSFGSFIVNQFAAQEIQGLLKDVRLRIICPKTDCNKPATISFAAGGRVRYGAFSFIHAGGKRQQHHGGSAKLPYLRLVSIKKLKD